MGAGDIRRVGGTDKQGYCGGMFAEVPLLKVTCKVVQVGCVLARKKIVEH